MMAAPEETLPLRVSVNSSNGPENISSTDDNRGKRIALGATAAYLVIFATICLPPLVPLWHPTYYAKLEIEGRGWTWLGANALWLALALFWTLLHVDNGPCVATACLLCSLLWAYLNVVLLSQACRGQLPLLAIVNAVVQLVMLGVCLRAAWVGVAKKSHKTRSDGRPTWRRVFRKWALVSASLILLVSSSTCCAGPEKEKTLGKKRICRVSSSSSCDNLKAKCPVSQTGAISRRLFVFVSRVRSGFLFKAGNRYHTYHCLIDF